MAVRGLRRGVEVRAAAPADVAGIAALLRQLEYAADPRAVLARLEAAEERPNNAVLVAGDGGPAVGLIAVHWWSDLRHDRAVARVSLLVVDVDERRRGLGRLLLRAGAQAARAAGCGELELALPNLDDSGEGFANALGFTRVGTLLRRSLRKRAAGAAEDGP